MIDTIILTIPREKVRVVDMTHYGAPAWDLQSRTRSYEKFVKNPSSRDLESGLYMPCITGYSRKNRLHEVERSIRVQFSAPKLIYKNNLDELAEAQFPSVVTALNDRLERMGVFVGRDDLENASVTSVHYSKNIVLKNNYTAQYVISELSKINPNKRFDFARARFMNEGQSLYIHASTHEFVVYDKVADLTKGFKRAIDRDQNGLQMGLFEKLKEDHEIIRFEARLVKRQKLNSLFKDFGFMQNPTFQDVFSAEKSRAVLMHYWQTMIDKSGISLFANLNTPKDVLRQIFLVREDMKPTSAIYFAGLMMLASDGNGLRELRSILTKQATDRSWYRISADFKEIGAELVRLKPRDWYDQLRIGLNSLEPYRLDTG